MCGELAAEGGLGVGAAVPASGRLQPQLLRELRVELLELLEHCPLGAGVAADGGQRSEVTPSVGFDSVIFNACSLLLARRWLLARR